MPEDLKLSQIGSSQLPPPFRGLHSPGVRKHSNYLCLLFPEIVYYLHCLKLALIISIAFLSYTIYCASSSFHLFASSFFFSTREMTHTGPFHSSSLVVHEVIFKSKFHMIIEHMLICLMFWMAFQNGKT